MTNVVDPEEWPSDQVERELERLEKRFPDFEWHCYSDLDVLFDIAIPLLNRVEALDGGPQAGAALP